MDKFADIKALVFDGFLTQTLRFDKFVVIIRTLGATEEDSVITSYQDLPKEYNLLAAVDTVKFALYSINGVRVTDASRKLVSDWPQKIIAKIFVRYTTLVKRVQTAHNLVDDFVKTNDSRLRWSVVKGTKTSLNSAVLTGDPEFESRGLTFIQQLWIYLNVQQDVIESNKIEWSRVEYMTDSICGFINPKAMRQVHSQKQLAQEEQMKKEEREEIRQIQNKSEEKVMIQNTADDLFDALQRKSGESALERNKRINQLLAKAFQEDEHDKLVREYEEFEFCRQLRIKKENARRAKILHEKKLTNAIVIDVPVLRRKDIQIGYHQMSTLGDDVDTDSKFAELNKDNKYFVNGIDYSEIVQIVSFALLKNREILFDQITHESDEETIKWINIYIEAEKDQSDVEQRVFDILKSRTGESDRDKLLDVRDKVLSRKPVKSRSNSLEDRQKDMIAKIQSESDEIQFGR
jgi:antitoxin component of RelBE/YafQ-DinJ toxin-antitoxin module